ncbi:unannotated protein [freshwater metagenome]|uniref:Unannotated protein n=1 Tax=freshwater metagenome TaxID=449393 RepID=A0A6J6TFJ9_9ZZZZ
MAWLPTILEVSSLLIPEIAYPTYNVGAIVAGARIEAVDVDAATWPSAELAWVNSPSNPTGRVHSEAELLRALQWARSNQSILLSDECYLEFGFTSPPQSILSLTGGDNKNVLALHSLSKRSNMAGYRAAFLVGDSSLVAKIREVRKHAGMMVSSPVQSAMIAALADSTHVSQQRSRYKARREKLIPALESVGFRIDFSHAGLYLWCTRNEDGWKSVAWLAERGILATPGSVYGPKGANHIRVALTSTDKDIDEAVSRLLSESQ